MWLLFFFIARISSVEKEWLCRLIWLLGHFVSTRNWLGFFDVGGVFIKNCLFKRIVCVRYCTKVMRQLSLSLFGKFISQFRFRQLYKVNSLFFFFIVNNILKIFFTQTQKQFKRCQKLQSPFGWIRFYF